MKTFITFILLFTAGVIKAQIISERNDPLKNSTLVNRTQVNKINGKPIEFYLNHPNIDTPAKLFYQGKYALDDNDQTFAFLDSVLTDNAETRPFYFFIFNQAIQLSDGALAEHVAGICRSYFEKHPCEFLEQEDHKDFKLNIEVWTDFIAFDINEKASFQQWVTRLDKIVMASCVKRKRIWEQVKVKVEEKLEIR